MLIIISDIHLGDGTCGESISDAAFHLFNDRLPDLAMRASWRENGKYQPIEEIHILLLGDILDILHSTTWLEKKPGEPGYVRPWTNVQAPEFAGMIRRITKAILNNNVGAVSILKNLSKKGIRIPMFSMRGKTIINSTITIKIPVHLHYMVGNHDWYFHLPGMEFDSIRDEIIKALGLDNSSAPFPHDLGESPQLKNILAPFNVYARHGDIYDPINYDPAKGRDHASLGDIFSVEIINRFPMEVEKRLGGKLPSEMVMKFRELVNIRPVLATSLWINGLLQQFLVNQDDQEKVKKIWNDITDQFLAIPFVLSFNQNNRIDAVDGMRLLMRISEKLSFSTLDEIVAWIRERFGPDNRSFTNHALRENAFLEHEADFIVYGHTHYHEVVPLDIYRRGNLSANQIYFNSGTWHPYYDLSVSKPHEHKFIPYQVMSYLVFYKDGECRGKQFETWKGTFSE